MDYDFRRSGMPDGFTPPFPGIDYHPAPSGGNYGVPETQETMVSQSNPLSSMLPPGSNPVIPVGGPEAPPPPDIYRVLDFFKYGDASNIGIDVGTTDVIALPGTDSVRLYVSIQNDSPGTQNIYYCFGSGASSSNGTKLGTLGSAVFDSFVPQNDLHVIADAAGARVKICFSNKPIPEGV